MRAYSYDLRTHLLRAVEKGTPKPEAAHIFGVSTRTFERYQQRRRETGDVVRRRIRGTSTAHRTDARGGTVGAT